MDQENTDQGFCYPSKQVTNKAYKTIFGANYNLHIFVKKTFIIYKNYLRA